MAFIFDSEEQFEDAYQSELDRYGELRERLFNGGTLSYGEMEELLAQAKTKGDEPVIDALGNVVDDPPTDVVDDPSTDVAGPVDAPADDMMAEALMAEKKARFDAMMKEACCGENELGEIEEEEDLDEEDLDEASWSQEDDDFLQDLFTGYSGVPARERDAGPGNGTEVTHRERVLAGMKADRGPKPRFKSPSQAKGLGDFDAIGRPDGADAAETADFGGSEPVEERIDVEEELHKVSSGPLDESFVQASLATLARIDV